MPADSPDPPARDRRPDPGGGRPPPHWRRGGRYDDGEGPGPAWQMPAWGWVLVGGLALLFGAPCAGGFLIGLAGAARQRPPASAPISPRPASPAGDVVPIE